MEFESNVIYHGFKMLRKENIEEIKSEVRIFEHIKSGARLIHLSNLDDDKLFSIGFRTTPSDSTGVAHILEHSVLCGSKKFKTKNPFSDMGKSSLHTFMNAMTYTDKTIYPVGSKNDKDFINLMDVYLDAVLHPRIYENHNILRQEGWRYELGKDNELTIKGVVYSEMQGALSSPEEVIINKIYKSLFGGTTYENVSGGDPEFIPDLTQDKFEEFHSKYYHPSNSYIYLYGNQNLDECLKFIDEEYLNEFDKIEVKSQINDSIEFNDMVEVRGSYSINEQDDDTNKEFLALNFAYDKTSNPLSYLTHKVLYNLFIESPASPIKRALLDKKIGESLVTANDMNMDPTKELLMPIVVKNAAKGKEKEFKDIVSKTLKGLVDGGINKDLLLSSINTVEFELREITSYKGLQYNGLVLESWLYDGDPTSLLKYDSVIKYLKEHIKDNYFEEFIRTNMINNKHCSLVVLSPEKSLALKKANELKEKLAKYKNSLTQDEIDNISKKNEMLKKEQVRKDTEEDKKTLPKLDISEINKDIERIPQECFKDEDITFLSHDIFTGKIEYIDLLFDVSSISKEDIQYLALLSNLLGELDTNKKDYSALATMIAKTTGGVKFNIEVYNKQNDYTNYIPKLKVSTKTVPQNIYDTLKLLNEILKDTKFENIERLNEVIKETRAKLELSILENGNSIGMKRINSMYNVGDEYKEKINGISYFKFLSNLDKNYDKCKEEIINKLSLVYNKVFNIENLIVSLTGEKECNDFVMKNIKLALEGLAGKSIKSSFINETSKEQCEAIITGSNVQYVVKGYNTARLGFEYNGNMNVMCNILDNEYLYPKIRLQGGAYGCYTFLNKNGDFGFFSYRDPNLVRTIEVYNDAYKFLENLEMSKEDIESFVIGTIGQKYKPLTPIGKSNKAVFDYICNVTEEDNKREKDEILSTTLACVKKYAIMIKEVMDKEVCCVVGNENNILENKNLFNEIN